MRDFDYGKKPGADCTSCFMFHAHTARGSICCYDEQPVHAGFRCLLYIENVQREKEKSTEPELFT